MTAIQALKSFDNIRTVRYVATTWCARNLSSVLSDVAAYCPRRDFDDPLDMNAIFVDETPTQYSSVDAAYLQTITQALRASSGLQEDFVGMMFFHLSIICGQYRIVLRSQDTDAVP